MNSLETHLRLMGTSTEKLLVVRRGSSKLIDYFMPTRQISVPKRVINLDLQSSFIFCINSNSHKNNVKKLPIRIPTKVLQLSLWDTSVFRVKIGFYLFLDVTTSLVTIQPRSRESIIEFSQWIIGTKRHTYLPKSIIDIFVCCYPPCESRHKRVYNLQSLKTHIGLA